MVLEVRHLKTCIQIGGEVVPVVNDLSFSLKRGETLAVVGESGCGKTMTALSLLRIIPQPPVLTPTGEVIYDGKNLLTLPEKELRKIRGCKIAMIFQDPMSALNPVYTIGDQLSEVIELHLNIYGDEARAMVVQALADVGIPAPEQRFDEYPHQLSGGMKQRVMIAMALLCEPDVLIADEPTTALDVTIQAQVLDLMRDLQKERGTAILLITHDMGVVAEIADHVMVMYATRVIEQGPVEAIFDHMAHPYTQGLFRSRPHEGQNTLTAIKGGVPPLKNLPKGCAFHPRCPKMMDQCTEGAVPLCTVGQDNHQTRCWLHVNNGGAS